MEYSKEQKEWLRQAGTFQVIDVRHKTGNFFPGIRRKAADLAVGEGLIVLQTFEPHPLCQALKKMGFDYWVETPESNCFKTYFYRETVPEDDAPAPYAPLALLNYPMIDAKLGQVAVDFWDLTWNDEKRYLPYEMRLLLSLANAVGAGRMRQASRELVKAYAQGLDVRALDDVFELLAWNQGIGYFSSEIGPSALFRAYKLIKSEEAKGTDRGEIVAKLKENFGEKNPEVGVGNH
jgi:hypothetical protein